MIWLPLSLAACGRSDHLAGPPPERPAAFTDPQLDGTGASPVVELPRTPGRDDLAPTVLPAGFAPTSRFPLEIEPEPVRVRRSTSVYRGPSPFVTEVSEEGRVSAPPGMTLFQGDQPLTYSGNLAGESWRFNEDMVLVALKGEQVPSVSVSYPPLENEIRRRDFSTAGLEPTQFVPFEVTLGTRTRDGLLLPAPSKAEWDVELPKGATFEAWTTIAPLPLRNLRSDGAKVLLTVIADGQETEIERRPVTMDDDFERWRVDLSKWGGRKVTVQLSSEPGSTPDFDYVFFGSPAIWGEPSGPVRRVVVIGLDTTRPDHFGFYGYERDTTPELDAVARTSTVFDRAWAPAPRTRPSFRTAFTGRRPLDAVGAKNIAEVFQQHGFATGGIVANVHLQPRFEFDEGFDDWWYDGQAKADAQVDRALEFLGRYPDRDTFLFLHVMDPHLFYNAPGRMKDMYTESPDPELPDIFTRWDVYGWMRSRRMTDQRKQQLVARYDAELTFMSQQLGRLYDALDRMPGRSLVVMHSDHGEEFWEHGGFEHNHTVYDETTRAVLWFRSGPGQSEGRRVSTPVTLADIAPTLFDFAGFTDAPPTDGRSLKGLLVGADDGAGWDQREIGVAHLRYDLERWGVVWRDHKYVLHTASGQEELYDLVADPKETKNLAVSTPLEEYRAALSKAHGMEVGRGWRIRVDLHEAANSTYSLRLPQAAVAAGVVDPEASVELPANQAWGEPPQRTPEDVGTVTLSEDNTLLTYTPGPKPADGLLYVLFRADVDPTPVAILRDGTPLVTMSSHGRLGWRAGRDVIEIVPGTVLIPPPGEGPRMRAMLSEQGFDFESQKQMLRDLGYLEDEDHGPAPAATPDPAAAAPGDETDPGDQD
jgi:arylsulfatase A-like enzyme